LPGFRQRLGGQPTVRRRILWRGKNKHDQPPFSRSRRAEQGPEPALKLISATFVFGFRLLHLELTALHNGDGLLGLVTTALGDVLDLVDDIVTLEDLAEDDVATIEPTVYGTWLGTYTGIDRKTSR
jgi:hypothetical protein